MNGGFGKTTIVERRESAELLHASNQTFHADTLGVQALPSNGVSVNAGVLAIGENLEPRLASMCATLQGLPLLPNLDDGDGAFGDAASIALQWAHAEGYRAAVGAMRKREDEYKERLRAAELRVQAFDADAEKYKRQNAALVEALHKHGSHLERCALNRWHLVDAVAKGTGRPSGQSETPPECDCGLAAALASQTEGDK